MIFTVIDFHTHVFPDKIAASTIEKLSSYTPRAVAHTDATLSGLVASMEEAKVDYSVIMPVLTAPHQFESVNRFAVELAAAFHRFYNSCRIKGEEEPLLLARLKLADATRAVIRQAAEKDRFQKPENVL